LLRELGSGSPFNFVGQPPDHLTEYPAHLRDDLLVVTL
jgi:hypothetical protein